MGVFQGHQISSLVGEIVFLAWFLILIGLLVTKKMPRIGRRMKIWDYFGVYIFTLLIPNSTYAILELRHLLIMTDHVADSPDIWSYLVFGGISLLGFVTNIYGVNLIVKHYARDQKEKIVYNIGLALICGLGVSVGLLNFSSFPAVFFPPALISVFFGLLTRPDLIVLSLIVAVFLFLCFLFTQPST